VLLRGWRVCVVHVLPRGDVHQQGGGHTGRVLRALPGPDPAAHLCANPCTLPVANSQTNASPDPEPNPASDITTDSTTVASANDHVLTDGWEQAANPTSVLEALRISFVRANLVANRTANSSPKSCAHTHAVTTTNVCAHRVGHGWD
jgi:hypothetical protein